MKLFKLGVLNSKILTGYRAFCQQERLYCYRNICASLPSILRSWMVWNKKFYYSKEQARFFLILYCSSLLLLLLLCNSSCWVLVWAALWKSWILHFPKWTWLSFISSSLTVVYCLSNILSQVCQAGILSICSSSSSSWSDTWDIFLHLTNLQNKWSATLSMWHVSILMLSVVIKSLCWVSVDLSNSAMQDYCFKWQFEILWHFPNDLSTYSCRS